MRLATPSSRRKRRVGFIQATTDWRRRDSSRAPSSDDVTAQIANIPAAAITIDSRRTFFIAIAARTQTNRPSPNAADIRVTLIGRQLEQRRSDSKRGHGWVFVSQTGSPPAIACEYDEGPAASR